MYVRASKPISRSVAGLFVVMWLFFLGASFVHSHSSASEKATTSIQADTSCPVCTWQFHSEQAQIVAPTEVAALLFGTLAYLCPTSQAPRATSVASQSRAPPFQISLSVLA
jgi:hypothetical protein